MTNDLALLLLVIVASICCPVIVQLMLNHAGSTNIGSFKFIVMLSSRGAFEKLATGSVLI